MRSSWKVFEVALEIGTDERNEMNYKSDRAQSELTRLSAWLIWILYSTDAYNVFSVVRFDVRKSIESRGETWKAHR